MYTVQRDRQSNVEQWGENDGVDDLTDDPYWWIPELKRVNNRHLKEAACNYRANRQSCNASVD